MKAVAKSGPRRLTIGMARNAAMSRPGREDLSGVARAQSPDRRLVVVAERHELEIFAAEQIGVGDEEDENAEAEEEHQRQRERVHDQHDAEKFQRGRKRAAERQRPAGRSAG